MEQNTGTIYIATNLLNGKQYVGQTTRKIKKRLNEHKNKNHNRPFSNAIKKYGFENFKVISFACPEEALDWVETFLEKEFDTAAPNGYNLESGGHKNKHHNEITKQKQSLIAKGRVRSKESREKQSRTNIENGVSKGEKNPFFGKQHTEDDLIKMKNHQFSEMHRQNISIKAKERFENKENHPMYGRKRPDTAERNKNVAPEERNQTALKGWRTRRKKC